MARWNFSTRQNAMYLGGPTPDDSSHRGVESVRVG